MAGLEILNASKMLGVGKKELSGIKGVKVSMTKSSGGIAYIAYSIKLEKIQLPVRAA